MTVGLKEGESEFAKGDVLRQFAAIGPSTSRGGKRGPPFSSFLYILRRGKHDGKAISHNLILNSIQKLCAAAACSAPSIPTLLLHVFFYTLLSGNTNGVHINADTTISSYSATETLRRTHKYKQMFPSLFLQDILVPFEGSIN